MRYQRTQIYLDPEDHRRLTEEAAARGISLAALLREIASSHVREQAPSYGEKSMSAIIGLFDGPPTDIAKYKDEYLEDAAEWLYWKKMGRQGPEPKPRNFPVEQKKRRGKKPG